MGQKEQPGDPDDPADRRGGDCGAPVAFDAAHRLVGSVVPGERTAANVRAVVADYQRRTGGVVPRLSPTDASAADPDVIWEASGEAVIPERTGKRGRPQAPYPVAPEPLPEAPVPKTRHQGRVVTIDDRVVLGTVAAVPAAGAASLVRRAIPTAFVERHPGTDRNRNARKVRPSDGFSQDDAVPAAVTSFTMSGYHCGWPVRTRRQRKDRTSPWPERTPARAAGLTDQVGT